MAGNQGSRKSNIGNVRQTHQLIEARIIRLQSGGAEALPRGDPEAEAKPAPTGAVTQICETQ